jgi:hypothetical protein
MDVEIAARIAKRKAAIEAVKHPSIGIGSGSFSAKGRFEIRPFLLHSG